MRILYGVVGEGMGHATRSKVALTHLLSKGHDIEVVVSGKAHKFLQDSFAQHPRIRIREIQGLTLAFRENEMDLGGTVLENLLKAPSSLLHNSLTYLEMQFDGFQPQAVISDFESWAYLYAANHMIPFIGIDNQQVINRCAHNTYITNDNSPEYWMTKIFTKAKLPGAYHYLATSFFFPPVKKPRTTLIPPILRPEILQAQRDPHDHILVYPSAALRGQIVPILRDLPYNFRVYGMPEAKQDGNVQQQPFSQTGFIEDFRTARAVIAGGGYSMMGEAVHLHVPMFAVPIKGQYEQEINVRYLKQLGYGDWSFQIERDRLARFLDDVPRYTQNLQRRYVPRDNQMLFGCLDELLHAISLNEPPPATLQSPAMRKYQGPLLPEEKSGDIPWDEIANPLLDTP
ncbi:teichoic acid biosynthesis protein [Myxococcota bacterium]|nr:teichoic acid biosynthesis protein [Myxococcota bacterium]